MYRRDHGLIPVGGLLAGVLAELYGAPRAIFIGGVTTVTLFILMGARFKSVRDVT